MNAAQPFLDILSANKERTAVVDPNGKSVSYGDLLTRVLALCDHLRSQGLVPGDRVVLLVPNGVSFAATAISVLLTGGVPVLIEPGLGDEVFLSRVKVAKPKWLLVHPIIIWVNRIPGVKTLLQKRELDVPPVPPLEDGMQKIVINDSFLDKLAAGFSGSEEMEVADRTEQDDGILIFTGGTTSLPKGVRLSHDALGAYISNISSAIEGMALENFLADTPQQVLYALRLGKTAYTTKGRKQKRAKYVLDLVRKEKIDAYFGSPYVWMEMMTMAGSLSPRLPGTLKTVLLGGAPVTPEFLSKLQTWLHEDTQAKVLYGMTEVGPLCAVRADNKLEYSGEGDLVGAPLGGIRLDIENPDPETKVGEVVAHSPSLYTGYLDMEERGSNEGLHTGDLGKMVDVKDEKMLILLGRTKDMIIRNGVNIYPLSFESQIRSFEDDQGRPGVREAALVGLWNPEREDEDVVCCVQPAQGMTLDMGRFEKHVNQVCGTDAKPDHFVQVDPIPVTGRQNKVDKQALRTHCAKELGLALRKEEKQ